MTISEPNADAGACALLNELAVRTWAQIEAGERSGIKLGEESITDYLLLDLSLRFPHPTKVQKWNHFQEATRTGADWDWWFVDREFRVALGLRIQAKRIDYYGRRFEGFDRVNSHGPQRVTLRQSASLENLHPIYCLYLATVSPPNVLSICPSIVAPPFFGCSLLGLEAVERSVAVGDRSLDFLWPSLMPWSCLVCCEGAAPALIERVDAQAQLLNQGGEEQPYSRITDTLPPEVLAIAAGDGLGARAEPPDVGATVVTVVGGDGRDET